MRGSYVLSVCRSSTSIFFLGLEFWVMQALTQGNLAPPRVRKQLGKYCSCQLVRMSGRVHVSDECKIFVTARRRPQSSDSECTWKETGCHRDTIVREHSRRQCVLRRNRLPQCQENSPCQASSLNMSLSPSGLQSMASWRVCWCFSWNNNQKCYSRRLLWTPRYFECSTPGKKEIPLFPCFHTLIWSTCMGWRKQKLKWGAR